MEPIKAELRGSNLDLVRRRNLSLVLSRVHTLGAISRAQLTRETGLNRSTIGALVAELVGLGLVLEREPDQLAQVGRPSPVIVPGDRAMAITVHPELDAVAVALVALGGRVLRTERYDTARIPTVPEVVEIVADAVDRMRADLDLVAGIGLAVPGLVGGSDGIVRLAPHLDWHDEPLGDLLRAATGYPVAAANDASLGAIAESMRGAGRGVGDLVYLNGGASGIGGGIISGGVLMTGRSGYAGEIGHTFVSGNDIACHCGSTGCLETEVSRAPLLEALDLAPAESARLEAELVSRYPTDERVTALVDRQLDFLARAIANTVNVLNPDIVVLGGFLGSLYAVAPERLATAVIGQAMVGPRDDVRISRAELGERILSIGAAEIAFRALLDDPALGRTL